MLLNIAKRQHGGLKNGYRDTSNVKKNGQHKTTRQKDCHVSKALAIGGSSGPGKASSDDDHSSGVQALIQKEL